MKKYRIGIATNDGIVVNQHFGRAAKFLIVEADISGSYTIIEERNVKPVCAGGNHEDAALQENVKHLSDCQYILVERIGPRASQALESAGISAFEIPDIIEDAIRKLLSYIEIQNLMYPGIEP